MNINFRHPVSAVALAAMLCTQAAALPPNLPKEAAALRMEMKPAYYLNFIKPVLGTEVRFINPGRIDLSRPLSAPETALLAQPNSENEFLGKIDNTCTDDDAYNYAVEKGVNYLLITLSETRVINQFAFFNASAGGSYRVFASTAVLPPVHPAWVTASAPAAFNRKGVSLLRFPSTEAKFVKVEFTGETRGKICSLYLGGLEQQLAHSIADATAAPERPTDSAFSASPPPSAPAPSDKTISVNMASLEAGTRVLYSTSSWEYGDPNQIIADMPHSSYAFSPKDAQPTLVMDFKATRTLTKGSSRVSGGPGKIDYFILPSLPEPPASATPAAFRAMGRGFMPAALQKISPYQRVSRASGPGSAIVAALASLNPSRSLVLDNPANGARLSPVLDGASGRYFIFRFTPASPAAAPFVPQKVQMFQNRHGSSVRVAKTPPSTIEPQAGAASAYGHIAEGGMYYIIDSEGNVTQAGAGMMPPEIAHATEPGIEATMNELSITTVNTVPTPSITTLPNGGAPGVVTPLIVVEPPDISSVVVDETVTEDTTTTTTTPTPNNPVPSP